MHNNLDSVIEKLISGELTQITGLGLPVVTHLYAEENVSAELTVLTNNLIPGLIAKIRDLQTQLTNSNDALQYLYDLEQEHTQ